MKHYRSSVKDKASRLSAVVLAGGKSSRFGRNKGDMELGGEWVIDLLVDRLRSFPFRRLALVRARGQAGRTPDGVELLVDDREGLGPMGGILTAFNHLPGDVLVAACDMPLVSRSMIRWLVDQYGGAWDAVIPSHRKGIEPLLGIYNRRLIPRMEDAVHSGSLALHSLLEGGAVRLVRVPPQFVVEREFFNVNTPEDYRRIESMIGKRK